jgi:hypothetical protein
MCHCFQSESKGTFAVRGSVSLQSGPSVLSGCLDDERKKSVLAPRKSVGRDSAGVFDLSPFP